MKDKYIGKIIRVNLTTNEINIETLEEKIYRRYLGGSALASYFLLRELRPNVDSLSENNVLVFACSILTGIPIAGTSRYTVAAKSPLTNGFAEAEAGGWWAPQFKRAGFDVAIITGRAAKPVYLWVHNGEVELKDASHLTGKTTGEAEKIIRNDLGDKSIIFAQTGPAGENLVRYACIMNNVKHVNGRTGLGAVMGSKNLRGIAVRGTKEIAIADKEKIKSIAKWFTDNWKDDPNSWQLHKHGTAGGLIGLNIGGILPTDNFNKGTFEGAEDICGESMTENLLMSREGCFACPIRCKRVVKPNGRFKMDSYYGGPEYETITAFGSLCGISDLEAIAKANELCNKYGLDTISTGVIIAFAMECFEKKIISKKETDGLELYFGNYDAMLKMIELIAKRKGFGDVLAEGIKRASDKFGISSKNFAMQVKGQEIPLHEPRGKVGLALAYALSPTGADHMEAAHDPIFSDYGKLLEDISVLGILEPVDSMDLSIKKVRLFSCLQKIYNLYNSLGICDFVATPQGILNLEMIVQIVQSVTGWRTSLYELMKVGERANNMYRCFNIREGFTADDDRLPDRFFEPLSNGLLKGQSLNRKEFEKAKKNYYEMQGWDHKGIPTQGKLAELDLEWIKID